MVNFFWFTLLIAANSLLLVGLTMNVSRMRLKHKVSLGDGGNEALAAAIRTHANGVEQVPIFALIVLALSYLATAPVVLAVLVIAFTLSRLSHALGMLQSIFTARRIGAAVTYLCQIVAAITLVVQLIGL